VKDRIIPESKANIRKANDSVRIMEERTSLSSKGLENKSRRGEQNRKNKIPKVYLISFKGSNCVLIFFLIEEEAFELIS